MKHETITVDVSGLSQVLDAVLVAKQLRAMPGVHSADVNAVSGSATVMIDAEETSVADIEKKIRECGYHCGGEVLPHHLCITAGAAPPTSPGRKQSAEDSTAGVSHDAMAHEMGHGAGMDALLDSIAARSRAKRGAGTARWSGSDDSCAPIAAGRSVRRTTG